LATDEGSPGRELVAAAKELDRTTGLWQFSFYFFFHILSQVFTTLI
jgi:hypothetical protein